MAAFHITWAKYGCGQCDKEILRLKSIFFLSTILKSKNYKYKMIVVAYINYNVCVVFAVVELTTGTSYVLSRVYHLYHFDPYSSYLFKGQISGSKVKLAMTIKKNVLRFMDCIWPLVEHKSI